MLASIMMSGRMLIVVVPAAPPLPIKPVEVMEPNVREPDEIAAEVGSSSVTVVPVIPVM